MAAAKLLKLAT